MLSCYSRVVKFLKWKWIKGIERVINKEWWEGMFRVERVFVFFR